MGRRRKRKQERREQRATGWTRERDTAVPVRVPDYVDPSAFDPAYGDDYELLSLMGRGRTETQTCGGCREFVEDEVGGRGECLHPGSGILSPWTDTAACAFYAGRRR